MKQAFEDNSSTSLNVEISYATAAKKFAYNGSVKESRKITLASTTEENLKISRDEFKGFRSL